MFKNQSSFSLPDKKNAPANSQPIEEMPVHTMAQDLQDPTGSATKSSAPQESSMDKLSRENLNEKQKTSPFLNSTGPQQQEPVIPQPSTIPPSQEKTSSSLHLAEESPRSAIIPILLVFFIILIAGAGAYYFFITRQNTLSETNNQPSTPTEEMPVIIPEDTPIIAEAFSTESPNYLSLDTTTITSTSFKSLLITKSEEIIDSAITSPVEFIVTDEQNNPIAFSEFAKMTGIGLSENSLSALGDGFSLFIVNDKSIAAIGMSIDIKNSLILKKELSKDEMALSLQLDPILLSSYEPSTTPFGDYAYEGQEIRYQNLISPQKLAIDYSIVGTQLIFATTKLTIESLIDSLVLTNLEAETLNQ